MLSGTSRWFVLTVTRSYPKRGFARAKTLSDGVCHFVPHSAKLRVNSGRNLSYYSSLALTRDFKPPALCFFATFAVISVRATDKRLE